MLQSSDIDFNLLQLGLSAEDLTLLRDAMAELADTTSHPQLHLLDALAKGGPLVQALGLPERIVDLIYAQAFARFNAGDYARARTLFQTLCLLKGDTVDHWLGTGISARALDELDAAEMAFVVPSELAPNAPAPFFHLADVATAKGDAARARRALNQFYSNGSNEARAVLMEEAARLELALDTLGTAEETC